MEIHAEIRDNVVKTAEIAVLISNLQAGDYRDVKFKSEVLGYLDKAVKSLEDWHAYADPFRN